MCRLRDKDRKPDHSPWPPTDGLWKERGLSALRNPCTHARFDLAPLDLEYTSADPFEIANRINGSGCHIVGLDGAGGQQK
jgi:hypothetical protein